jgi:L-alanine-DL-glutamate epimerase-like enolase superfamily enzyme
MVNGVIKGGRQQDSVKAGRVKIPDAPGIGIELKAELMKVFEKLIV